MNSLDKLILVWHFLCARCKGFSNRDQLDVWQARQLKQFLRDTASKAEFYKNYANRPLSEFPLMDKQSMLQEFAARNTAGAALEELQSIAMQAENSRDFNPEWQGYTVGLSSGTSGKRGIFLVSKAERLRWAGILLARTLPSAFLWQIIQIWKPRLRIAFFLRANSNLYNTLNSSRIDFRFYDLMQPLKPQLQDLEKFQPQALVAPASILQAIAREQSANNIQISPERIINVAEVLDQDVAADIEKTFKQKPHQIYQATEGFLGVTCSHGNLHLNETYIHIEKNWLDKEQTRFQPIITDFTRNTQLIIRYQLNDILRPAKQPCPCGNPELHIEAVEGRADEILWLKNFQGEAQAIYPDSLRRLMMMVDPTLEEYRIVQQARCWQIFIKTSGDKNSCETSIRQSIQLLCEQQELTAPEIIFAEWQPAAAGTKRRRLICESTE